MMLYFDPAKLPRSMTKAQWKDAHRWVRQTTKKLHAAMDERLAQVMLYGRTMDPALKCAAMNKFINPPMLLGPGMADVFEGANAPVGGA